MCNLRFTFWALQATCALRELFAVEETGKLAQTNYAVVMSALFTRVASCVDVGGGGKVCEIPVIAKCDLACDC